MRVLICGDVHLGAVPHQGISHPDIGINTRLLDYMDTLLFTIDKGAEMGADVLVFTGDIFEHRKPSLTQQKIFSQALHHAVNKGFKDIHIVVGNHDQQRQKQTTTLGYLKELKLANIHVHDEFDQIPLHENGQTVANLIFMPFRDRKWFGVETYAEAVDLVKRDFSLEMQSIENTAPRIVVGHFVMEGTLFNEGYADLYNENQLFLPISMFDKVDITVMGHVHEPAIVSHNPYVAYVGSMEKRGGFEAHDKLFGLLDVGFGREAQISFYTEPCRMIFDIDLDLSGSVLGDRLNDKIFKEIDNFATKNKLKGSIVRLQLKLLMEDEQFCDTKKIINHLKEKHNISYCADIVPSFLSQRQARDNRITERISDADALMLFIQNTEEEMKDAVLEAGLDIIKMENENVASSD